MAEIGRHRKGSAGMTPYAYRPGNSFLHRMPGTVKLLGLLGLSVSVFFAGPAALAAASLVIAGAAALSRISPRALLRGSRSLLLMLVVITIFRTLRFDPPGLNREGFTAALLFAWMVLVSFSAGALLFSVTTMSELRDSIGALEGRLFKPVIALLKPCRSGILQKLRRGWERPRLCLGISLMLGFLPRFFEAWESAELAYRARGGKRGIPQLLILIPLVTERMIEAAAETAQALEARGLAW